MRDEGACQQGPNPPAGPARRQLPGCQAGGPCCLNPAHSAPLLQHEIPHIGYAPPPYTQDPESICSEAVEVTRQYTESSGGPWCRLAYWELSSRVGRLLPVTGPSVDVFYALPHGNGMCLETVTRGRCAQNSAVLNTRPKVGRGIKLFRDGPKVFVHNSSQHPIFVNSPILDPPGTEKLTVFRVPPGWCLDIFDFQEARTRIGFPAFTQNGPFDPHAVRISFAKGWGLPKYSRQCVTSCPCWLEVLFNVTDS